MAWCRQATNRCISQCWLRSIPTYDITRPQWVNPFPYFYLISFFGLLYSCLVWLMLICFCFNQIFQVYNYISCDCIIDFYTLEVFKLFFIMQDNAGIAWLSGVYMPFPHAAPISWWRHQMETFSALLALCAGNSLVTGESHSQRPVTWSFDVFFDLHLNKHLSKHLWGWWFEMPSHSLWRHCNVYVPFFVKSERMDYFMCFLEYECAKRLKAHSQASLDSVVHLEKWHLIYEMVFKIH